MAEDDIAARFAELSEQEKHSLLMDLYDEILDVVIYGQCLEFHRAIKLGYFFEEEADREDQSQFAFNEGDGTFNGTFNNLKCKCPKCKSEVKGKVFARHLENCMGFGRVSSRKAREGIASAYKDTVLSDEDCIEEPASKDDGDDGEWSDRKTKKKKGKNIRKNKKK